MKSFSKGIKRSECMATSISRGVGGTMMVELTESLSNLPGRSQRSFKILHNCCEPVSMVVIFKMFQFRPGPESRSQDVAIPSEYVK
jgi:hypothetical protein